MSNEQLIADLPMTSFGPAKEQYREKEGLVMLGCSGKIEDWKQGAVESLVEEEIGAGEFKDFFEKKPLILETTGGRHDLVFFIRENTKLNMGRLVVWRLRFGDCSWWSDYMVNYANQHLVKA